MNDGTRQTTVTMPGMARPDDLFARLDALGIETETVEHAPVFTVEESRGLRGALPGAHCKTLFFKDKKGVFWLCVVEETRRLDIKALSTLLGLARLSFASPERVRQQLGVEPGAVTPFALINEETRGINVVLDTAVMAAVRANFHPLVNDRTTAIRPADLERFIADCGHDARGVDFESVTRPPE